MKSGKYSYLSKVLGCKFKYMNKLPVVDPIYTSLKVDHLYMILFNDHRQ